VRIASLCFLVAALVPRSASAGRSFYGWLYGTEVMPERGAELQTWVVEEDNKGAAHSKETSLWWGPLIGVTDQLELALPVEFSWEIADGGSGDFTLQRFGIEARYRFVSQDPVDAPAFAPLVRVAVKRDVTVRDIVRPEADVVGSYEAGAVHALIDLGMIGEIGPHSPHFEFRPGAGVSVNVVDDLRLGGEVYAELSLDDKEDSWAVVGPDLSWTHGRFWLTATFGIGVYNITAAPRFMWGIAF